ncbi:MAG: M48 family metalloprotease [Ignavibacteriales bacterium]|jgi:predicted Zn-dependent protease|nr:M48 family metalloprotease [Ignavibacteriaceae bacterium]NLH60871.1 M48 family metalloprotease [Ignavibacteriales bacterium]
MLKRRIYLNGLLLILFAALIYGCSTGINLFSDKDEVALGDDLVQQILANPKEYPVNSGDAALKKYIQENIFNPILASPQVKKRNVYKYRIEIIRRDDVMNAFALPGGPVFVYTGLLKYLDSEAALAGVLAHEVAHIESRHATKRLSANYGVSLLLSLVLGQNPSALAEIATNLFVGLAFLANSRSDEDQADRLSVEYLKTTKYYPGGVKFFFEKMKSDGTVSSNSGKIATFLSTHPDPIERIAVVNQNLKGQGFKLLEFTSNDATLFKTAYTMNIKSRLK